MLTQSIGEKPQIPLISKHIWLYWFHMDCIISFFLDSSNPSNHGLARSHLIMDFSSLSWQWHEHDLIAKDHWFHLENVQHVIYSFFMRFLSFLCVVALYPKTKNFLHTSAKSSSSCMNFKYIFYPPFAQSSSPRQYETYNKDQHCPWFPMEIMYNWCSDVQEFLGGFLGDKIIRNGFGYAEMTFEIQYGHSEKLWCLDNSMNMAFMCLQRRGFQMCELERSLRPFPLVLLCFVFPTHAD